MFRFVFFLRFRFRFLAPPPSSLLTGAVDENEVRPNLGHHVRRVQAGEQSREHGRQVGLPHLLAPRVDRW